MRAFRLQMARARPATLASACLALALIGGCSKPPRGIDTHPERTPPADEAAPAAAEKARDTTWSVSSEGEVPAVDVAFEEDELPPAPEDVEGEALSRPPVEVEVVEGEALEEEIVPREGTPLPIQPSVTAPVEGRPSGETRGFRVQLLASREQDEARRVAREAEGRLQVPTYVVFEAPFYKVRAGDFPDRGDALALRDRARGYGYPNAWVVTTEIAGKDG